MHTFSRVLFIIQLFLILFAVIIPGVINAQDTNSGVTGRVLDADSGESLPGANIVIAGTGKGTSANENGRYSLSIAPGTYSIAASFIGFVPDTMEVTIKEGNFVSADFELTPTFVEGEAVIVRSDRLEQRMKELSDIREERRADLNNYRATVHKLAIIYETRKSLNEAPGDTSRAVAYAERYVRQLFKTPNRYAEEILGRRASGNYFANYDIFGTNGEPLEMSSSRVQLNLFSEVVTVVGPISPNAGNFYELDDQPADSTWPEDTTELKIIPKTNRVPLFEGSVFINDDADGVIGMDLKLNEAGEVFAGLYSMSNFSYFQRFEKIDKYWLPVKTRIEARIGIIGFKENWIYVDNWNYSDYEVNTDELRKQEIPLSGLIVADDAGNRNQEFWDKALNLAGEDETEALKDAQEYKEERTAVNAGMAFFRAYFEAPFALRRFYFTNVSDFYRINRVEGNYVGVGLRTPDIHENFIYKGSVGYATDSDAQDWRYYAEMMQFLPGNKLAVEGGVYKRLAIQFADRQYNNNPLNIDMLRNSLIVGTTGIDIHNYYEREGFRGGLRYRFQNDFFFRVNYLREDHTFLPVVAPHSWFKNFEVGGDNDVIDFNLNPDVGITPDGPVGPDGLEGFTEGELAGFEFHFHYDNRQFQRVGVYRDYDVRKVGWFTDQLVYWSDPQFGSSDETFKFLKYRSSFGVRVPVFASQYLVPEFYFGGSNNPLPGQFQFGKNGFMVDDFTRRRPFVTLEFNEAVGNRVSVARLDYLLGSSFARLFPFRVIRQSGVQLRVHTAFGFTHDEHSLSPVTPWTNEMSEQIEIGFALTQIFGMFKIEGGVRVSGNQGEKVGFILVF